MACKACVKEKTAKIIDSYLVGWRNFEAHRSKEALQKDYEKILLIMNEKCPECDNATR